MASIAWTLADPAPIAAVLDPAAMVLRGALHPSPEDGVPPLADGTAAGTLLLLGWTGGVQWGAFATSPEAGDGAPDPLNRWTRRLVGGAAAALGARVLYPGDGPPYLPFQRWAMRAEGIGPSPLGLLIHPEFGLWHSYRGALALRERLALVAVAQTACPCAGCARPCLAACPVGAFTPAGYDMAGCAGYLAGPAGVACMTGGCAARLACPVRPPVPYGPAQLAFHMAALAPGLARVGLAG